MGPTTARRLLRADIMLTWIKFYAAAAIAKRAKNELTGSVADAMTWHRNLSG